jgi:hypothetical protein
MVGLAVAKPPLLLVPSLDVYHTSFFVATAVDPTTCSMPLDWKATKTIANDRGVPPKSIID